jgi:hypothetical protein
VPALIDRATPLRCLHENSFPVAIAKVCEIDGTSGFVEEDEIAAKLTARSLFLQLVNDEREHVHFALARCVFWKADSGEAMDAPANS